MRVLAAEDDDVSRLLLCRALERLGHEPVQAQNGAEAWNLFRREPFLVVVSDWMMPLMDGLTLCELIRTSGSDSYTYFILLTAKSQRNDRIEALNHGVDDFLTKPLDRSDLAARMLAAERILSWQRQLQDVNELLLRNSIDIAAQGKELERLRQEAMQLATHDGLTGVLNRRAWFQAAEGRAPQTVAVFDIDYFKAVNDDHGHPAGDAVLIEIARRLSLTFDGGCTIARIGGEEFIVGLDLPLQEAMPLCQRALRAVADTPCTLPDGSAIAVTVSGGLARCARTRLVGRPVVDAAYKAADLALYRAKAAGRARLETDQSAA